MSPKISNVDRVYLQLRSMAANFEFKPDARINESSLSLALGASRTPLREALNRLVAEGFLTFKSGRGFFCRSLSPALVLDLYEARAAVETEAVRLATMRASDAELNGLNTWLESTGPGSSQGIDAEKLLKADEEFHLKIAELSQNGELLRLLVNLNDRVRYIRLIYLRGQVESAKTDTNPAKTSPHKAIMAAILDRKPGVAMAAMRQHIERRREDASKAVRIAYSQLYVPEDGFAEVEERA
ncbi:MAG: GntR family transcriptional regulator [Rhodobacteraceae bacterium]|nr:GntR family transcriptional regulator [Paracoccaceae bacterium]